MTKRYLKDWAYSKIIDYQLTAKASTSYTAQGAVFALSERRSCARRFEVSPAGAVVAPAKQGHPQDDRNPSRAFYKKESKRVLLLCFYRAQARDEVDAKASTSYTAKGAVFCIKRA